MSVRRKYHTYLNVPKVLKVQWKARQQRSFALTANIASANATLRFDHFS
jgi:hypothetical protein